jgi:hypothetical protein
MCFIPVDPRDYSSLQNDYASSVVAPSGDDTL